MTTFVSPNLAHAPAPYHLTPSAEALHVVDADGHILASLGPFRDPAELFATAALFKFSPALLDAIERAMAVLHPGEKTSDAEARHDAFQILSAALEEVIR